MKVWDVSSQAASVKNITPFAQNMPILNELGNYLHEG